MLFKIDENMPLAVKDLLSANGYETHSVFDESLRGASDKKIAAVCQKENRIILTLDKDFSDIRVFPPQSHSGIIVLRPPRQSAPLVLQLVEKILPLLKTEPLDGHLWVADLNGVRMR
ncbi:hypothetical protein FACS18942_10080 [Planctomycetales bacterium]|nr:hypothetical protein FACS18942_10080 [Planctomycetales bacterium]GHT34032.1 hypothetical protein FACS189427_00620 [Planctomycetales bacterium]